MRHASSRQLFDYWNRIRDNRVAPTREEIEPSDIRNLLSDTFILEVSGTLRTISYRLAGTRLCAAFGRELKGYGFLGHWSEDNCFDVAKVLSGVYCDFKPTVLVMRGFTESGKQVDYEMVILPLEPMADGSTRLLGIATPAKDYYWLGAEPLVNCTLRSARQITDLPQTNAQTAPLSPSLMPIDPLKEINASAANPSLHHNNSKKVAHLTVHDGGKS